MRIPFQLLNNLGTVLKVTLKVAIWVTKMTQLFGGKFLLTRFPRFWSSASAALWWLEKTLVVASWILALGQSALTVVDFALIALACIGNLLLTIWNLIWSLLTLGYKIFDGIKNFFQDAHIIGLLNRLVGIWKSIPRWAKVIVAVILACMVSWFLNTVYWKCWSIVSQPIVTKIGSSLDFVTTNWLNILWSSLPPQFLHADVDLFSRQVNMSVSVPYYEYVETLLDLYPYWQLSCAIFLCIVTCSILPTKIMVTWLWGQARRLAQRVLYTIQESTDVLGRSLVTPFGLVKG